MGTYNSTGYVYLIQPLDVPVYKIGVSIDVEKRIARKEKEKDYKLEIICSVFVNDRYRTERILHNFFHRYRLAGEWFTLPPEVVENFAHIIKEASHER